MSLTPRDLMGPESGKLYDETGAVFDLTAFLSNLSPKDASPSDVDEPAVNTDAVVTYAAVAGEQHVIGGVAWSYDAAPAGSLTIEDGAGNTVFVISILSSGENFFLFPRPLRGTVNTAMIVSLTAGGAAVTGKLSVLSHWTE